MRCHVVVVMKMSPALRIVVVVAVDWKGWRSGQGRGSVWGSSSGSSLGLAALFGRSRLRPRGTSRGRVLWVGLQVGVGRNSLRSVGSLS